MRFGPAGNSERFYAEGHKSTAEAPAWLAGLGLDAMEYSFGRGVQLSQSAAEKIAEAACEHGIRMSAHAPYFVNLANPDPEKREKSLRYILDVAQAVKRLGGDRVVVHVGAQMELERAEALANCRAGVAEAYRRLEDAGLGEIHLCPETMGKRAQIGDLAETLSLCLSDARLIPCVDFAHLHALTGGGLREEADFVRVLDAAEVALGVERARGMHIHFSTIEFTGAGEKRHRTFAEADYGPRFEQLAPLLAARGYHGTVICECSGTQADDAAAMQALWRQFLGR
ncbi:MAG: TIM barrel protein [Clostridia bacterium]|nr:TIM barrel protein [Clostridia bacterium]